MVDELEHVHVLHEYTDATLGLQELMRERMKMMTPQEFERVLHPIFEQDELTLIIWEPCSRHRRLFATNRHGEKDIIVTFT